MLETPVVLLTYRRPETTRRVLEQIAKVRPRHLYVSGDGPRSLADRDAVQATRRLFDDVGWDCEIHRDFSDENLGLALRATTAITRAFERYEELIVLEDDTLPDPSFFRFCSEMLERYRGDERVMQIKGTCILPNASQLSPDSYLFTRQLGAWGWASWKRVWDGFDTSVFRTKRARRLAAHPRRRLLGWNPVWKAVQRDKDLLRRVMDCGSYYFLWMYGCETGLIPTSYAGPLSVSILKRDGLVVSPLTNLITNIGFGSDAVNFTEAHHAMAGRRTRPMTFPLSHPPDVEVDEGFQRRCARALDRAHMGSKSLEDKLAAARFRRPVVSTDDEVAPVPADTGTGRTQSLSVVVEWDNVKLSELDRTRRMFEALFRQLRELTAASPPEADRSASSDGCHVELIVGFNSEAFRLDEVQASVEEILPPLEPEWTLEYVSGAGIDYYEIKNLGASRARGDLLIFVDSDVVPEPGWLRGVLAPFDDPGVQYTSGNTYIDPESLLAKTFALNWFAPLRAGQEGVRRERDFFANNVVFRRSLFDRFAFPAQFGASRGACRNLAELLDREGIVGCRNPAAQVSHPAPNGLSHFLIRGLIQGRDLLLNRKHDAVHVILGAPAVDTGLVITGQIARGLGRLVTQRREVGLSLPAVPLAMAIWAAFAGMQYVGLGLELVRPGLIATRYSI